MFDLTGHSKEKQRLFMDRHQQKLIGREKNGRNKILTKYVYIEKSYVHLKGLVRTVLRSCKVERLNGRSTWGGQRSQLSGANVLRSPEPLCFDH